MKRYLLLALLALSLAPRPGHAADARRPNIVLILADDTGCDLYSCYGGSVQTPQVDRLAAQGVRFQTAWSAPLCTPSRMMLLTGLYPFHSGWVVHHDVPRWGGLGFDPDKFTSIARTLKDAGYATAIAGKWQINDLRKDPKIMQKHGFDEYCLWTGVEEGNPPSERRYWDAYLEINGDRGIRTNAFGPDLVQQFALDFIEKHRAGPFFVYYPMIVLHDPLAWPPGPDGRPQANPTGTQRSALMAYLDRQVGELRAKLEALGIADNTVVVFAGDNGTTGGGMMNGVHTPGGKGRASDLGVHVPLVAYAPMLGAGPLVSGALTDFTDLYPTLTELAGATPPPGVHLDGRSLVPVLAGRATQSKPWLFSQLGAQRIVRDERWILHSNGSFYDLEKDPFEKRDLRETTAPAAQAARKRLAHALNALPADGPPPFEGYVGKKGAKGGAR